MVLRWQPFLREFEGEPFGSNPLPNSLTQFEGIKTASASLELKCEYNATGFVYAPLIFVDRKLFHTTQIRRADSPRIMSGASSYSHFNFL